MGRADELYGLVPPGTRYRLYLAIFCTFAPIAMLLSVRIVEVRSWPSFLLITALSGAVGLLWALVFIANWRWIVLLVPVKLLFLAIVSGALDSYVPGSRRAPTPEGAIYVALIVAGYVFFFIFIMKQGTAALRLRTELDIAQQIHGTLVPPIDMEFAGLRVLGHSEPSSEMGGDLVDVIEHRDWIDMYIADVSGHGVRAGVIMSLVKGAIRTALGGDRSLEDAVGHINSVLCDLTTDDMFATAAFVRFARGARVVEFQLAGHNSALVRRSGDGSLSPVESHAMPLGISAEESFPTSSVELAPGDLVLLYTDGLSETKGASGAMYGDDRLAGLFGEVGGGTLDSIRDALLADVAGHGAAHDDRSLLLARVGA